MKKIVFTDCEFKELESIRILGGIINPELCDDRCTNNENGCAVGRTQKLCLNKAHCYCNITLVYENCPQERC